MLKLTTIVFLIAASTLAISHLIALQLFLYWRYFWFDMPMHILGGSVAALGVFAFRDLRLPLFSWMSTAFGRVMVFVVLVMFFWEAFELWAGIPILDNFISDTLMDLAFGFIGGLIGYYVGISIDKLR